MGIKGLLPALADITQRVHVRELRGKTACVDSYSWLHKGAYCCATDLVRDGDWSRAIAFCMKRARMLQSFGVRLVMVLDGAPLPSKGGTEDARRASRERNKALGDAAFERGDAAAANDFYNKAVDVSPEMAKALIDACDSEGIAFVVAPFEADAQLADLCRRGVADFAISEDGDCLAFGCQVVLFKLGADGFGNCVDMARLKHVTSPVNLAGFSHDMFLDMCILCGCDYLPQIKGVGVTKACDLVRKYRGTKRLLRGVRMERLAHIPRGYEVDFLKARLTFKHQMVFPYAQGAGRPASTADAGLVPLQPVDQALVATTLAQMPGHDDLSFAGPYMDDQTALRIARGELNPLTKEPFPVPVDGGNASLGGSSSSCTSSFAASHMHAVRQIPAAAQNEELPRKVSKHFAAVAPAAAQGDTGPVAKERRRRSSSQQSTVFKRRLKNFGKPNVSLFAYFSKPADAKPASSSPAHGASQQHQHEQRRQRQRQRQRPQHPSPTQTPAKKSKPDAAVLLSTPAVATAATATATVKATKAAKMVKAQGKAQGKALAPAIAVRADATPVFLSAARTNSSCFRGHKPILFSTSTPGAAAGSDKDIKVSRTPVRAATLPLSSSSSNVPAPALAPALAPAAATPARASHFSSRRAVRPSKFVVAKRAGSSSSTASPFTSFSFNESAVALGSSPLLKRSRSI